MLDDMLGGMKDGILQRMSSEEAAVTKAQIVVVKGGTFANTSSVSSDPFGGLLGDMEIDADLMNDFNDALGAAGIEDTGPVRGYTDGEIIKVQLNPNSYTIRSETNFHSDKMGGVQQSNETYGVFGPPNPRELSVELFYDTSLQADYLEKIKSAGQELIKSFQSVTNLMTAVTTVMQLYNKFTAKEDLNLLYLNKLLGLTTILKGINTPALISFQYGSTVFEGYTKEAKVEYQRFNKQGEVIRAKVSLQITESNMFADKQQENTASAAPPDISASSVVQASDVMSE